MILIPILIAFTGGFRVYGHRGGVVGAVALVGAMMAPVALPWLTGISLNGEEATRPGSIAEIGPTILAAFILGPLTAWLLKKWDNAIAGKVKGGFEMLVDNFAAGIIGGAMAVVGLYIIGPITFWISQGLGWLANALVNTGLLPLVSIVVEPAKVLFLNNAINHGVFTPLGIEQAADAGKSIFFMIESNPGPGLGILTAMLLFGPRAVRPTVPAAMVVHFLGGIHEIYFPYVLLKPILVVAAIVGGATGVLWESIFDARTRGPGIARQHHRLGAGVTARQPGAEPDRHRAGCCRHVRHRRAAARLRTQGVGGRCGHRPRSGQGEVRREQGRRQEGLSVASDQADH